MTTPETTVQLPLERWDDLLRAGRALATLVEDSQVEGARDASLDGAILGWARAVWRATRAAKEHAHGKP